MSNDFSKLKEILASAPTPKTTLKIFQEANLVSEDQAVEMEQEIQAREEAAGLSFDEIISALVDEDCLDIAKKLHEALLED